ncbi:acylphosphatase [bacterium]|nr:MAG: acylphosphatase [bacterium]
MDKKHRVHMIVHGRVQGVFFRDSTRRVALEMNLTGIVRNLMDGSVEIIAEGPREELDKFVLWTHQGPPSAVVDNVDVEFNEATGEYTTFSITYRF